MMATRACAIARFRTGPKQMESQEAIPLSIRTAIGFRELNRSC